MGSDKEARLAELREKLADLKSRDPSHCSGSATFTPHSIPPSLYRQIEDLEEEIKALE